MRVNQAHRGRSQGLYVFHEGLEVWVSLRVSVSQRDCGRTPSKKSESMQFAPLLCEPFFRSCLCPCKGKRTCSSMSCYVVSRF